MTLDQEIQVWNAIGTWVAGLGTFAAVALSLWLTVRKDRVNLNVSVGIRQLIQGNGTAPREFLMIKVTNRGERPVTVSVIGWTVGKKRGPWSLAKVGTLRQAMQTFGDPESDDFPKELPHGKSGSFLVALDKGTWADEMMNKFIVSTDEKHMQSFIAHIYTSVGQTVSCKPEKGVLDFLRQQSTASRVAASGG